MSRAHVDHKDIAKFAEEKVNLPADKANEYRAQVRNLRDRLDTYLTEHPDFAVKKMLLSGSLAKGTALRSLNDIDVACYISGADTPQDTARLLEYLAEKLMKAFPNFTADNVKRNTYSITVSFKGSGLDVDIVPILYDGDPDWYGNLVSQDDGSLLKTSIPLHLEFIRKRKKLHDKALAQAIRLAKYWARKQKNENENFRFKSFMVELVFAHLADKGYSFTDYPDALQHFFTYLATSDLKEKIIFTDYYAKTKVGNFSHPVQIIDPVNELNNVSSLYTQSQADAIVQAALDAGDAIDSALNATTKEKTVYYWQKVFGTAFQV